MRDKLKSFWILFALQFWSYGVLVLSMRAIAQANYVVSIGIDAIYGAAAFFVIKHIAKHDEDGYWGFSGYTIGGAVGTAVGIWLSKVILGQ